MILSSRSINRDLRWPKISYHLLWWFEVDNYFHQLILWDCLTRALLVDSNLTTSIHHYQRLHSPGHKREIIFNNLDVNLLIGRMHFYKLLEISEIDVNQFGFFNGFYEFSGRVLIDETCYRSTEIIFNGNSVDNFPAFVVAKICFQSTAFNEVNISADVSPVEAGDGSWQGRGSAGLKRRTFIVVQCIGSRLWYRRWVGREARQSRQRIGYAANEQFSTCFRGARRCKGQAGKRHTSAIWRYVSVVLSGLLFDSRSESVRQGMRRPKSEWL